MNTSTTQSPDSLGSLSGSAFPCAYRLTWSRYENPSLWNRVEIVATMWRGEDPSSWAIREGGCVLTKKGEWEMEPIPSSRTEKFLSLTRWDSAEEAAAFAAKFHSQNDDVEARDQ